jgi:hypothetical protein
MYEESRPLTFADYQYHRGRFAVDRDLVRRSITICEPLVIEALSVLVQPHLWRGELPVYPVMTSPPENGGWGHLMPVWFKPQDRPIPLYALDNWALFALVYAHSFGPSDEAKRLVSQVFTAENVVRVVVGTQLQLPFLPSTQGRGHFFRHGMLPFLLSILWLEEDERRAWLRLHELGAQGFIERRSSTSEALRLSPAADDLPAWLDELEHTVFGSLERNAVTNDQALLAFLSDSGDSVKSPESPSLFSLYQAMFGAVCLGITALAAYYRNKPLDAWRDWILQELIMPYRMYEYGIEAITSLVQVRREA